MPASPSNEPQPHTLSSEEQVYIGARIAKAIRQLLWGIAVPAVYFGALNYWLTGPREFLGLGSAISLILAIGFFATFALTFHLLLAGMTDLALFVRYRRDPAIFHRRLEGDTSWLYAPPGPWPKLSTRKESPGKSSISHYVSCIQKRKGPISKNRSRRRNGRSACAFAHWPVTPHYSFFSNSIA